MYGRAVLMKSCIAPRKVRVVANLIRLKSVSNAYNILKLNRKKCCTVLYKLLLSAVSNCEKNMSEAELSNLKMNDLFVKSIRVDYAGSLKRFLPAARGRGCRILKRMSNIVVEVG